MSRTVYNTVPKETISSTRSTPGELKATQFGGSITACFTFLTKRLVGLERVAVQMK